MIKLIACDVDGTLTDKTGAISEYNVEMIQKAIESGIHFVIASGRDYNDITPLISPYNLKCACITGNGAKYINEEGKIISNAYLPYEQAIQVIEILNKLNIHFMIYTTNGFYSIEAKENVQNEFIECLVKLKKVPYDVAYSVAKKHHSCFKLVELENYKTALKDVSIIKVEAFESNENKINEAKEILKQLKTVSYLSSTAVNLELTNQKATKGKILLETIKNLGINKEEVMVIGDSYNDISMFEIFENSVVMENGPEEVKAMGKYVTKTNLEDGVGYAINKWIFKEVKKDD